MDTETRRDRLIRLNGWLVIATYLATSVHHLLEGTGLIFGFRLNSLLVPLTFAIPLAVSLALLRLVRRTGQRSFLIMYVVASGLWWVLGIGIVDGFYNHTLTVVLAAVRAPASLVAGIFPTYHAALGGATLPCDGVTYSYCNITGASVTYEVAGIASFVTAGLLAVALIRLLNASRRLSPVGISRIGMPGQVLVGAGMVAGIAMAPVLTEYMDTGRIPDLLVAIVLMLVCAATIVVALLRARTTNRSPVAG
jgi:hypothetical protein